MSFDFSIIQEYWKLIISGIPNILLIAFICAILGTVIGLLCTLLRKSNGILQNFWWIKRERLLHVFRLLINLPILQTRLRDYYKKVLVVLVWHSGGE